MMQMRIKTKTIDKYYIKYLSKVYMRVPKLKGASPLPATFTLVASDTKWDDVVKVVTFVIVHPVSGEV